MVESDQRRRLALIKMTMERITDLLVQLLQSFSFRVDGLANGTGTEGAVLGFFNDEQDLVHLSILLGPV